MPLFKMPPNPKTELLTWCRTNRPDMLPYMEEVFDEIPRMGKRGEALLLLACSAFAAGRWYQATHSDEIPMGSDPYRFDENPDEIR